MMNITNQPHQQSKRIGSSTANVSVQLLDDINYFKRNLVNSVNINPTKIKESIALMLRRFFIMVLEHKGMLDYNVRLNAKFEVKFSN